MRRRWTLYAAVPGLAALLASGAIAASGPAPPRSEDVPEPAVLPALGKPADGRYTLRAIVLVSGFTVRTTGPTFVRSGEPVPTG